ncbi:MAG: ABC transporter ATP-binding protein [Bryobacterales bacterium]|nr:ABC transporter ATP-binding protein [Bryobacterales bacterium]
MEEEVLGKSYDGRLMRRLLVYLRPYRAAVSLAVAALLANAFFQTVGPILTKTAIDRYMAPSGASTIPWLDSRLSSDPVTGMAQLGGLYLFAVLAGFLLDFLQAYTMQWTGQHAMFDLRRQIISHLQRLDVSYFDKNPVGRLVTRVTTDVDVLNELFAAGLVTIIGDVVVLLFILGVMFRLNQPLTFLMLAVIPFVVLTTMGFRRSVQTANRQIRVAVAKINAFLQEHINGIVVLQLFNREERSVGDFDRINAGHRDAYKGAIFAYGWFYPVVELFSMTTLAALLWYGGYRIQENALTLGVLVAFFQYGMRLFRPIQDLSEKYNILQSAMAASERIFLLLEEKPAVVAPVETLRFPETAAPIEFDRVWFAYKDEDWVLRDVSFRIDPGETIAVVGHTGAGKTTLINLLLRFYDVQRGSVKVGGIDIRRFAPRDLREHFGVVLQDPHLFTGTIASNIRLGTDRITASDLQMAAEQVNLTEFIEGLPKKFEHDVRERGSGLSTGQKQLISFARALAHNPRYLILDEATSSVDTETELRVREALARLVEGRTSIIIAHRLSTIQRADRILVMHKGQLREMGPHQQLLALRGIYWKLYQLQYKDQELAAPSPPPAQETIA